MIPEKTASATVEACAAWIDQRARESTDPDEQERLGALAEAMRFDRVMIVAGVVGL